VLQKLIIKLNKTILVYCVSN